MRYIHRIGRAIRRRRVTLLVLVGVLAFGIVGGIYAVGTNVSFTGQTQAGDHEWWSDVSGQAFCENCHTGIGSDIAAGPHASAALSACSNCHSAGNGDHAAAEAACTDCHTSEANDLESGTEAHSGIMASLGESPADASQTCQSCHTHAEVTMSIVADDPIPLQMGGP